jgi:putative transposase
MSVAKRRSAYWYWERNRGRRLWQRSFWDRVLRSENDVRLAMRYTLNNPVRAGFVERPLDYPFSGSSVYDHHGLLAVFGP